MHLKDGSARPAQMNRLDANLSRAYGSLPAADLIERRSTPRITTPFPATVRGVDRAGDRFTIDTVLDNFSAAGLCLRLVRPIELGATMFVVVRFTVAPAAMLAAPGVAARAVVVWAAPRSGAWAVAIKFTHQRFLYAAASGS
jgi:PilZ domain